jgi:dTDP-4-amino-4,6-dideoxygalactose transaminase
MIGRRQLRTFEEARQRRLYVARRYREGLQDLPGLTMATPPADQEPIWLYFPIRLDPAAFGLSRDEATAALAAANILCRKYFDQPCHEMPAYRGSTPYPLPVTDLWASATIALPVYNDQTDEEIDYIVERIRAIHVQAREVRAALVGVEA